MKPQVFVLPLSSTAEQETGVLPIGKTLPEAGVQTTVGVVSHSSVAVTVKLTTPPVVELPTLNTKLAGQVMIGAMVSRTVTVVLQVVLLPELLTTVNTMFVVPMPRVVPGGGFCVMVTPPQ